MILLAVIVGVNMVAFYLTMAFFMIPLERLANRLKAKEKVTHTQTHTPPPPNIHTHP